MKITLKELFLIGLTIFSKPQLILGDIRQTFDICELAYKVLLSQKSNTQVLSNSDSKERLQKLSVNNMLSFLLTVIVCSCKVWLLFLHASQLLRLEAVGSQLSLL